MAQNDVPRHWAKQRDARPDQYGHSRDHQSVDTSSREKALNGDPAVDVRMLKAAGFEPGGDFGGFSGHLLHHSAFDGREIERTIAQDHDRLRSVKPPAERQYDLEGPAADNDDIDARIEFFEAVGLLPTGIQEIERVVRPGQKTIDAYSAKNRELDGAPPEFKLV
ncbi:MAG TPA: hypothetical protein VEJ46_00575 [Candidatus Acidoferrum sp.]|nr:hypothetical protein [Candidatus Acidoferrum sp.]